MTISLSPSATLPRPHAQPASLARPGLLYGAALLFWLATRWLVLVHQGAWPWMNAFVVAAARGIVVGDWNEAVRPVLPAVLGVPLVLVGATEQQAVAGLYLLASLVQFGCFLLLVRALYPGWLVGQGLALLVFLLVPYDHSIHHYRDVPVLFAQSALYLLTIHWLKATAGPVQWVWRPRSIVWAGGTILLGIWSRMEVLAFVGLLLIVGLGVWRGRLARLAVVYAVAAIIAFSALLVVARVTGVDLAEQNHYQFHTFLDSTPADWLTPECRANPTENCREHDGLLYFGPGQPEDGVWPLVLHHPWLTLLKTARSAFDNATIIWGANLSTYPGIVPLVVLALLFVPAARAAVRSIPGPAWIVAAAAVVESLVPPLSWAPPHPQYHLQTLLAVLIVLVPLLAAVLRLDRGRLVVTAFFLINLGLSAVRYSRYAGP